MTKSISRFCKTNFAKIQRLPGRLWRDYRAFWRKNWRHKLAVIFVGLIVAALGSMYGIALWYQHSEKGKPHTLGVTFVPDYAQSLGVDPKSTMDALISDLHVRQFRLTSYWSDLEPSPGQYDFSQLDWQFQKAEAAHASVSLAIGLRQPRWPECHMPSWAASEPMSQWQPQLEAFMRAVISRYKHSPSLKSYQLENEFFLNNFGTCTDYSRSRLLSEFNLVKQADPSRPIIMSRSNNFPGWVLGQPRPDLIGMSIYRRVWDGNVTHRYFNYPLPSWYYSFLAGMQKMLTGKDSVVHELQAEAWPPHGKSIPEISLAEQNKSMNAARLTATVAFGRQTGMPSIDLWGSEYWYYRKVILHDPSVWNAAKTAFAVWPNQK